MKYAEVEEAVFLRRPNRFIADVRTNSGEETVHVKNTGRCKELLVPGARVILEKSQNLNRKTRYSLVAVYKGEKLINMDSQAPNQVVYEAVSAGKIKELPGIVSVKREVTYSQSRFDLGITLKSTLANTSGYIEVKGVTLEQEGMVLFPDAPTERGAKHVAELIGAADEGYRAVLFFLIQMQDAQFFRLNEAMDEKFARAVRKAHESGVLVLAYDSLVTADSMVIGRPVEVRL
ncbi:DNA/RNA nuclease SfsA [Alicyclobacillus sp. SO9]|nr:DNA/RNA nuclease SfsA [Alicyclobacillus sp. SO9]QQE80143.1 DNA/RNA nuclease SfsA [Alicyclobacillus sp. SO9]